MKKFGEMGVSYTPADGKKRFPGKTTRLGNICNKQIEVHDYEKGINTSQGDGNYSAPIEVSPIGMSDHLTVLQQQELHCISNFRSS